MNDFIRDFKMRHSTSLILLPLVVLFSLVLDISEADPPSQYDFKSLEYEGLWNKLQEENKNLKDKLFDCMDDVAADNDLIRAVISYRKVYAKAEGTSCAGKTPPKRDNDYELMMSYIDDCTEALPKDEINAYVDKILESKAIVEQVDIEVDYTCNYDHRNCEFEKEEATKKLKSISAPEFFAGRKSDVRAIIKKFKTNLEKCLKTDTAELLDEYLKEIEATNTCLAAKS